MNVILVVADTFRRDHLGCYGNPPWWEISTPNLDRLGEEAIIFDRAYVGSFPTIPMRADLFTGNYVFHTTGWAPIASGLPVLAKLLRAAGYVTMMVTDHLQMLAPGMNYHQGFAGVEWIRGQVPDVWHFTEPRDVELPCKPEKMRNPNGCRQHLKNVAGRRYEREQFAAQTFQAAMDWLDLNYKHDKFFLYIDTFDTHEPWDPPQWYVDMYDPDYEGEEVIWPRYDKVDYLTDAELRHTRALYAGCVTLVDRWMGKLLQKLRDMDLMKNTAIIFTSDHGFYIGDHGYIGKHTVLEPKKGWQFYQEVAQIPLLMKLPDYPTGIRSNLLVQPVDLMPTILELCGVGIPGNIHGASILPALRGESENIRDIAVTSQKLPEEPDRLVYNLVTDGEWTLIHAGNAGKSELYNVLDDPAQENNLIREKQDVAERLHSEYLKFLERLGVDERKLKLRSELH